MCSMQYTVEGRECVEKVFSLLHVFYQYFWNFEFSIFGGYERYNCPIMYVQRISQCHLVRVGIVGLVGTRSRMTAYLFHDGSTALL